MNKEILFEEMLQEVKNLKDLTKEQLPLVAQEYIKYNTMVAILGITISLILGVSCIVLFLLAHFNVPDSDNQILLSVCSWVSGILSFLFMFCNLPEYLIFKFQPRRMAIKAITSLHRE